jgi:hypothetical protein
MIFLYHKQSSLLEKSVCEISSQVLRPNPDHLFEASSSIL